MPIEVPDFAGNLSTKLTLIIIHRNIPDSKIASIIILFCGEVADEYNLPDLL